ncbi:hypothetical protein M9H77_17012 [Catharanthus roseus]|uniref:Uncharacterized protein n=1 Tax=Catharanthus roseus TaxID=4058 RepID=A0ACC0B3D5_CATRO|nr:hypothetical protein M9H77_17012 [Catharanthus roseus]
MSDDVLTHFSSNSSNQSDQSLPTKIAKLEARMVGKPSSAGATVNQSQQSTTWPATTKIAGPPDNMAYEPLSSDSDDDNGEEFLIQANTQKRRKFDEDNGGLVLKNVESMADTRQKNVETMDSERVTSDSNRKRQSRGRGNSSSGRGRGSRGSYQTKSQTVSALNSQPEKDEWSKDQIRNDDSNLLEENCSLREKVASLEESLTKFQHLTQQLEKELKSTKDFEQLMKPKRTKILSDLLISLARAEREEARTRVRQDCLRLGNVAVARAGTIISEAWEDGPALKDLNVQLRNLLERKEAIERQRKLLKKRQTDKGDGTDSETGGQEDDFLHDELFRSRLGTIKREEEMIMRERDRYELEKARLIREMKRIRDEDGSRFNNFQILNHRYALLNLLGKGGFSEVYKAFDLVEYRYVACKLHGLNAQWSEEKKQSYIRHAIREYNIHKTLVHQNIVRLWDIFEIDQNTFCTVLEYCSGKDLDAVLKSTQALPEREARSIIVQIFRGLVYLNRRSQKIIHYDLKPGNVLFDELAVAKVTDFGLSKIVEDDVGSQGMELTSQGAGTYWYLPPECFELNKTPLISSKVDVWSAGVLLYQMLFGKRPFGHDQTQERILREDTIINARKVEFPSRPAVSNEAKDFIRRCLTYNQAERPDVLTIAQDPYLTYAKK